MRRYDTRFDNGTLYVEGPDDWLEIGPISDIQMILGGETYTIEYDERAQATGWLDTDEDGTITFDIRETIEDMSYDEEFVTTLAATPLEQTDSEEYPHRLSLFAEMMQKIWDSKGNLEDV